MQLMQPPLFWHRPPATLSRLLAPLSALYTWAGARRLTQASFRAPLPVLCVGNVVAGGAGKTPICLSLLERLQSRGHYPHALTRGYGGTETGPCQVAPDLHEASRVGDEALLLATKAPTWVSRHRPAGAVAAAAAGADVLVLDDGFQNPSLAKDVSLLVVDGGYGFGNGCVMPSGPCREPPARALSRAQGVVILGADTKGLVKQLSRSCPLVLRATLLPDPGEAEALRARRIIAFAGIGRPTKFFETLTSVGAEIIASHSFPDHHPYRRAEIEALLAQAMKQEAYLVTTAKDRVRVPADLRPALSVLTVTVAWEDMRNVDTLLDRLWT